MAPEGMDALELVRKQRNAQGDGSEDDGRGGGRGLRAAEYGTRPAERVNRRNGYREREWDTRLGTIPLEIPKLRQGTYFPGWLLEPRKRAERALVVVIAEAYVRHLHAARRRPGEIYGP